MIIDSSQIDFAKYDFVDVGSAKGGAIDFMRIVFRLQKCLCMNIDKSRMSEKVLKNDCIEADITKINLPVGKVKAASISHVVEHLNGLEDIGTALAKLNDLVTDCVFINFPFFDADEYLKNLGLKFMWSDWTGHKCNIKTKELIEVVDSLKTNYILFYKNKINNSTSKHIIPLSAPTDQLEHKANFGEKPFVKFDIPVYQEVICMLYKDDVQKYRRIFKNCKEAIKFKTK